jgi:hypothetical protein
VTRTAVADRDARSVFLGVGTGSPMVDGCVSYELGGERVGSHVALSRAVPRAGKGVAEGLCTSDVCA